MRTALIISYVVLVSALIVPASLMASQKKTEAPIILTSENTVQLSTRVNGPAIDILLQDLFKLKNPTTVYLVINSEGGEVQHGFRFLKYATGVNFQIKTITRYSASTAFHIVQALDQRLILENGVVMGHRMRTTITTEADEDLLAAVENIFRSSIFFDTVIANRMGLTLEKYRAMSKNGYRAVGPRAVKDNAVDMVVTAKCDESLAGDRMIKIPDDKGKMETVIQSNCPL